MQNTLTLSEPDKK